MMEGDIADHEFARFRGNIALVAGGPPCQPYSLGGLRQGEADKRDGIPDFIRAVREISPDAFLMENVPGLASGTQIPRLMAVVHEFEKLGFDVKWNIVRAADFGVSQRRRRLLIVGTRHGGFAWPDRTHGLGAERPWVASREVLSAVNPIGEQNDSIITYARNPDLRPSPWDGHLWNGGGRPIDPNGLVPTVLASMGGNKTPWLDGGGVVVGYHAHLQGGGAPRTGQVEGARRITVLEAAKVQTFPSDMPWIGRRSSQYRQIGNAVPVLVAEAAGRALLRAIDEGSRSQAA